MTAQPPMDSERIYRQLGRLLEAVPDFTGYKPLTTEQLTWIGRAHALVQATEDITVHVEFDIASKLLNGPLRSESVGKMMVALHKALGIAELAAPPSVHGSFIAVGNSFDAFAALSKLLLTARSDVLIVDPYMDETVLTEFASVLSEGVALRLLSDESSARPSLAPAANRWTQQHGTDRPLEVRLAAPRTLHDRVIFIDAANAWTLTQSLKDFAKRSPAEIVRANDTASLKIAAYEAIWQSARIVV